MPADLRLELEATVGRHRGWPRLDSAPILNDLRNAAIRERRRDGTLSVDVAATRTVGDIVDDQYVIPVVLVTVRHPIEVTGLGMGGVFFRRRHAPTLEVVNDRSQEVATLFRVLQRHYLAFVEMMRFQLTTRAEFERLVATDPSTLTDLERAARFYYLQRTCFGGKLQGQTFGVSPATHARFDVTRLIPDLAEFHERLAGVVIERLPYEEFIPRYDRAQSLFYLDPPYLGSESDYGRGMFDRSDFARLAVILASIKGRFILSLNDCREVREVFQAFTIESVATSYTVANGPAKKVREVIITGPSVA